VANIVRSLWNEPPVPDAPARVWRDWVLVGILIPTALLEAIFRPDVQWRPFVTIVCIALIFTLLWRRTHALQMAAIAFGGVTAIDLVAWAQGSREQTGLNTVGFVLILAYAAFRWGSGRQAVGAMGFMAFAWFNGAIIHYTTVGDLIGGALVLLFPALLGAEVRHLTSSRRQEIERVKADERAQLARELHDTVAHHVSAIAIQAQAGRAVAPTRPEAATEALERIEEEASRTLAEMRAMVGSLRDGDQADLAPQRSTADIARLARQARADGAPEVRVDLAGDLDDLRPSVGTALYRLAQEAVTNATRHAHRATRIDVDVEGHPDCVTLTVRDDGELTTGDGSGSGGYGLIGMTERAKLLGGTFTAGPNPTRGWTVGAVLPRTARSATER
jgi:signal transduction histidine kinase